MLHAYMLLYHLAVRTWVGEDVRVAFLDVVAGEGPVVLGGAGVMVVQDGHSPGWPQAQSAWGGSTHNRARSAKGFGLR